MAEEILI